MPFRYFLENKSPDYNEVIDFFSELAVKYTKAFLFEFEKSDLGKPIHLFIISSNSSDDIEGLIKNKSIILINNGIHGGEPCGIDACMNFALEILQNNYHFLLEKVVICIIPILNIGGMISRNYINHSDINLQNSYGFRSNSKNIDLNRDFIKCKSLNTKTFIKIFHILKPHVFIDTHSTKSADYQYFITICPNQIDLIPEKTGLLIYEKFMPYILFEMNKEFKTTNYLHCFNQTAENGIKAILDSPRYSSGYVSLFGTIGFTSEAHMLKEFKDIVLATKFFIFKVVHFVFSNSDFIKHTKEEALRLFQTEKNVTVDWTIDKSMFIDLEFEGYKVQKFKSIIGNYYNYRYISTQPETKTLKYFNRYKPKLSICKPDYYIIPQGWVDVIEHMKNNCVKYFQFSDDIQLKVEVYYIDSFENALSNSQPHKNTKVIKEHEIVNFYRDDFIIPLGQTSDRYVVQMLEPQSIDSFFSWHFFDSILDINENFSYYLFEDIANKLLSDNKELFVEFQELKNKKSNILNDKKSLLTWIYERSNSKVKNYSKYPIYRYYGNLII